MSDHKRHAPLARRRTLVGRAPQQHRTLPHAYLGKIRRRAGDIYTSDHAESRRAGRLRWLISTCLAAGVGAASILVVIVGSMDPSGRPDGLVLRMPQVVNAPSLSFRLPTQANDGLNWAVAKTDKMFVANGAVSTRYLIHETMRERRGQREFIRNKAYARIQARLAPVGAKSADRVPAFNPYKLYAANAQDEPDRAGADDGGDVSVKIVELLGGILPGEDGQELDNKEVTELVRRAQANEDDNSASIRPGFQPEGAERPQPQIDQTAERPKPQREPTTPNTTDVAKSVHEADDIADDLEGQEVRVVKIQRGDTLLRALARGGAEGVQARAIVEAAGTAFTDAQLAAGQELHVTLVPSVTRAGKFEPVRFSIFASGHDHKITVARNQAGEFIASTTALDNTALRQEVGANDEGSRAESLYVSVYHAALSQDLSPDQIMQVLRIHAYETDFRRRVRAGDSIELFYDVKDEDRAQEGAAGELLATSIATGGEQQRFYRFRTPDGVVDYYDEDGNTSRKFLMKRPVRGDTLRLASGFGWRRHPLLGVSRMHFGVDWSGPTGTPIMAAGAGVIEEARYRGEYGNYVRIRHANGYKTAYGHMVKFAPGINEGTRVRQGQIIGFIGSTGLSSGPHLHYEVLVNNQHVDPMSLQVPRERKLSGKQLADFQKERTRIDDLMRRTPVSARVAEASAAR